MDKICTNKTGEFSPKEKGKEDPLDRLIICGDHFTAEDYEGINTSDHHSVNELLVDMFSRYCSVTESVVEFK